MRFGFVTCVQLGLEVLDEILAIGHRVDGIVTLDDHVAPNKSGRVRLDDMAERHDSPLWKTENINDAATTSWLRDREFDWLFIIGWSQIAGIEVLDSTALGCLGMHPTLLPVGRGRASVPWAIIKGLPTTGVTMFQLDNGVDTGPIVDAVEIPVPTRATGSTLYSQVSEAHRELIRRTLPRLASGWSDFQVQDDSRATHWPGRSPSDGAIETTMTCDEVDRLVRSLAPPYPPAHWTSPGGLEYSVYSGGEVAMDGSLKIPTADGSYYATVFWARPGEATP